MTRILYKFFKILLWTVVSVAFVVIAAVLVVLKWPQLVINRHTLDLGAKLAGKSGYRITWNRADIGVINQSWLRKGLRLGFDHLCVVETERKSIDACFDEAELAVLGSFEGLKPRLLTVGPVRVLGGRAQVDLDRMAAGETKKQPAKKDDKPTDLRDLVPSIVRDAVVGPIDIEVPHWVVVTGGQSNRKKLDGSFAFNQRNTGRATNLRIATAVEAVMPVGGVPGTNRLHAELNAQNPEGLWAWNDWSLLAQARGDTADRRHVEVSAKVRPHFTDPANPEISQGGSGVSLNYELRASSLQGDQHLVAQLVGELGDRRITSRIQATARNLARQLPLVRVDDCELSLTRPQPRAAGSRIAVDCPVRVKVPVPPQQFSAFEIPTEAGLRLSGNVSSSEFIPSSDSMLKGGLTLVLDPVLSPVFRGGGKAEARLNGKPSEFPARGSADVDLAFQLEIPKFQKLVAQLDHTAWEIPAPVRVLEGSIVLDVNGKANLTEGFFPLHFATRLASKTQSLNVDANSTVEVEGLRGDNPGGKVQLAVLLSDVQVELPRIGDPSHAKIDPPPRFVPDANIIPVAKERAIEKKEAREAERKRNEKPAFDLDYVVRVKTAPNHPVRILTNLAKAAIPVNLDLSLSRDHPISGQVQVAKFPVEFFHRHALVDHFDIQLDNPMDISAVDGLVKVPIQEYIVKVQVVGTMAKPQVVLSSDPPVPQNQLMALLLFGAEPSNLDEDQGQSAASAQAALSAGAMNLASLYFLASTPIQSVQYDPTTGAVTTKVKIAKGTSLNLGTGSEEKGNTVGIKKRLGHNFSITSDLEKVGESGSQKVTALLEWSHRY